MDGLASFFLLLLVHSLLDVINGICGRGSQGIQLGDPSLAIHIALTPPLAAMTTRRRNERRDTFALLPIRQNRRLDRANTKK